MARPCPHCQKPLPAFKPGSAQTCPACGKDASAAPAPAGDVPTRTVVRSIEEERTIMSDKPKPPDRKPRVLEATMIDASGQGPTPSMSVGPRDPMIGKTLGNSEILSVLGKGAMGVVYKARQVALDRIVAVKTIRPEFCTDEQLLERFQREAKTVGRFNTTYVVQVYDVGFAEGQHYIVMEFVSGGNLKSYTQAKPNKRLTVGEAVRFLQHAAEGLLEAEKLNIVHRDIKPENLLLDQQLRVKITDFGIAKMLGATIELTGSMGLVGTPLYMSPEQCRGEELSPKSDMYSLGATFYHMLTGTPPCKGESVFDLIQTKTRIERLSPRRDLADGSVPEQLSSVIELLTALKPKDRYGSFAEVLEDLKHIPTGDEPAVGTPPKPRRPVKRRKPVGAIVGAVVLLAAAGGAAWYASQPGPGPEKGSRPVAPDPDASRPTNGSRPVVDGGNESREAPIPVPRPIDPPVMPGPDLVKVRTDFLNRLPLALRPLRAELTTKGPVESARLDVEALLQEARRIPGLETEPIRDLENLLNDFGHATTARQQLDFKVDPELRPPFDPLGPHLEDLAKQVLPRPGGGPEHETWLQSRLAARRVALVATCKKAVEKTLVEAESLSRDVAAGTRPESALSDMIFLLSKSAVVLEGKLPEGKADWTRLLGREKIEALGKPIAARTAVVARIRTLGEAFAGLDNRKADFKTTRAWAKLGEAWVKDLTTVEADLITLSKEGVSDTDLATLRGRIEGLRALATRWQQHAPKVATLREDFVSRNHARIEADLTEARKSGLADTDVDALAAAWTAIGKAGRLARRDLELGEAQAELKTATARLEEVEVSPAWTNECSGLLGKLLAATQGRMARVPGGTVAVVEITASGQQALPPVEVPGFFIDRTECTVGEFKKFFDACKQDGKTAATWYEGANAFQRHGQSLPPYLQKQDPSVQEQWPVVQVNWHQARALLRWQHPQKMLPTRAEWWLAAKGPAIGGGHSREYPWGSPGDPSSRELWAAKTNPCVVDAGGLRVQASGDDPIHHLAGNVAEWILDPVKDDPAKARVIGGDHSMEIDPKNRAFFAGKRTLLNSKSESALVWGFRGVLHPGDALGGLLP
jgi:serine/threonine protein kinase/formylglycine-generating enzyme required for sulfatase activity